MGTDLIYLSIGTAITLSGIIVYGLLRGYKSGILLVFGWYPKIIRRAETPLQYWFWFIFYLFLIVLIISMSAGYVRSLS